jgi:hypothetical protein
MEAIRRSSAGGHLMRHRRFNRALPAAGPMTASLVGASGFAAVPTTDLDLPGAAGGAGAVIATNQCSRGTCRLRVALALALR